MTTLAEMRNITKRFPGVTALNNISFDVRAGEVHVLLGENGAGKSTLMKILSGAYEPTSGTIVLGEKEYKRLTPAESTKGGISIIYQELSVINELSIEENIFVGKLMTKPLMGVKVIPIVDHAQMNERTSEVLQSIGLKKKPQTIVGNLSISEKQMVEIGKAIAFNAQIIIMDEPTSSLTDEEVNQLFAIIRKLKEQGKGIIYISHKLKEIIEIGDRVTVLKDGSYVGTHAVKDITEDQLVSMMVGRQLENKYHSQRELHTQNSKTIFEVRNLTRKDEYVKDISFQLHEGEILGFSGLVGAGRSELMDAIFGAVPKKRGKVFLHGQEVRIKNPYDAMRVGLGFVTENRRETGFFPNFSIRRNLAIVNQVKTAGLGGMGGLLDFQKERQLAEQQQTAMQIKCRSLEQSITQLSGGNQQKVILGKWMAANAKIIIFDEPTKGIDVGTKAEIYKLMRVLAEDGTGVIVVSSELPELLSVCDRILVFSAGRQTGEFLAQDATEEKLVKAATAG